MYAKQPLLFDCMLIHHSCFTEGEIEGSTKTTVSAAPYPGATAAAVSGKQSPPPASMGTTS